MKTISFTANKIKDVEIRKYNGNKYIPEKASLVELNPEDTSAVRRVADAWNTDATSAIKHFVRPDWVKGSNVYAITDQTENFKQLEPNKVLGMMLTLDQFDNESKYIACLQTNPKDITSDNKTNRETLFRILDHIVPKAKNKNMPPHKHIGQALVEYVIDENPEKTIQMDSVKEAFGFYDKLGFKFNPTSHYHEYPPIMHYPVVKFLSKLIGF